MTTPLATTNQGLSPSAGPPPSNTLNTAASTNAQVFQAGADAVTGKNSNNFNVYRYPHDIATSVQPHYVIFYINVRKSQLTGTSQTASSINFDQSSKNTIPTETQGLSTVTGITGGANLGSQLANTLGISALGAPFALVGAIAGGAFTNTKSFTDQVKGETTVLLKDVIALYLNGKPSVQYSASWADVDIGLAGSLGQKFGQAQQDIQSDWSRFDWHHPIDSLKDSKTLSNLLSGDSGIAASLILRSADKGNGAFGNFGAALQADAAIIPNPFKAQLFHTMGFRTFTFDYTFLPKNKQEYDQVQAIIKTFKTYMHPVVGGDKFIMHYPAEFSIAYYYKGGTNDQLFKMTNCALTTCKVEYGGTDFTTFKRIPGGPTEISMQLAFVETELLTRAHVEVGY